ncbi:MAG: hypothetical protein Q9181_000005 [Wetmoreana brouardii]
MATTHTISRRKPATYGKASRKPLSQLFSSSTLDPVRPISNGPALSTGTSSSELDDSGIHASPRHPQQTSTNATLLSPTRKQSGNSTRISGIPRSPNIVDAGSQTQKGIGLTLWDPSSPEESTTWTGLGRSRARKRRKHSELPESSELASTIGPLSINLSPSKHSKFSLRQTSLANFSTSPSSGRVCLETTQAPVSESQNFQAFHEKRTSEPPVLAARTATKPAVRGTRVKLSKTHSADGRSQREVSESVKETENAPSTLSHAPQTPRSSKSPATISPPRQEELWSLLLPKTVWTSGSNHLNPPSLDQRDQHYNSRDPHTIEATNSPRRTERPSPVSNRHRKLVDRLQSGNQRPQRYSRGSYESSVLSISDNEDVLAFEVASALSGMGNSAQSSDCSNAMSPPLRKETSLSSAQHLPMARGGSKATYSCQRSYLANSGSHDGSSFDLPFVDDSLPHTDTKSGKRQRTEAATLNRSTRDPKEAEADILQSSSMRTIHELREAGENVRHLNDTEALFDEIDGQDAFPISLKRERMLELLHRLQEPAYGRLLIDQGFETRLLAEAFSREHDAMMDALLAAAVLHLVAAPLAGQAIPQSHDLRAAELLASRLGHDCDLLSVSQSRRSNISKKGQSELRQFIDSISHSAIWRGQTPAKVSSHLIGLQGLEYLVRKRREAGCKTEILPSEILQRLVKSLFLGPAPSMRHPSTNLLLETQLIVSILESCTISGASHGDEQWNAQTLEPVLAVLPWLSEIPQKEREGTQALVLRLYLNLTNNNPRLCQHFARLEAIHAIVEVVDSSFRTMSDPEQRLGSSSILDTLILALGTLINLVEWSLSIRLIVAGHQGGEECYLHTLVTLFLSRRELATMVYSEEETAFNVAFGYLSVLLSYLCVEEEARIMVMNRLEGKNLQPLLDAVEEFLQYHRQIDEELGQTEGELDLKAGFVSRLEGVVGMMKPVR